MTSAEVTPDRLEGLIRRCGRIAVGATLVLAFFALGFSSFSPRGVPNPPEAAMFDRLIHALPLPAGLTAWAGDYISGHSVLASPFVRGTAWTLPILLLTGCFLVCLRALIRTPDPGPAVPRLLVRYAVLIALVCLVTHPVFTNDFWLSFAWGRMVVEGQNPYYIAMTPASVEGLPLTNYYELMTYGPAWGLVSATIAKIGGRREWLEFLLFKVVLTGTWIVTLLLVRRIGALTSCRDASVAVCIFGWMPMSARYAIAEGHNDIAMVAPMMLWLFLLTHQRYRGAVSALVVATLVKYVTAPLIAADLLAQRVLGRVSWRRYAVSFIPAIAIAALALLPFARDTHFIDPAQQMQSWVFWTPSAALVELSRELGFRLPLRIANAIVMLACAALIVYAVVRFFRGPSLPLLLAIILAFQLTVLFSIIGHVWPWFLLWSLPIAALVWNTPLAWVILILAAMSSFLDLHWLIGTDWHLRPVSGVLYYMLAFAATAWIYVRYRLPIPPPHQHPDGVSHA